jgi:ketosteroid isomerase-like protein
MPEESTTPDLVELVRRLLEAANRRDLDVVLSFFAPNAVWETVGGLGTFEGHVAIRRFWEDWYASYEKLEVEPQEILDLGNGMTFAVVIQKARLVGSGGDVRHRTGFVGVWVEGLLGGVTNYSDTDEARAAAERLAEERAQADV